MVHSTAVSSAPPKARHAHLGICKLHLDHRSCRRSRACQSDRWRGLGENGHEIAGCPARGFDASGTMSRCAPRRYPNTCYGSPIPGFWFLRQPAFLCRVAIAMPRRATEGR
jgi:hypothetical protein